MNGSHTMLLFLKSSMLKQEAASIQWESQNIDEGDQNPLTRINNTRRVHFSADTALIYKLIYNP